MKKIIVLLALIAIFSCHSQNKINRDGEPTIYGVQSGDPEMNKAIETAKLTLSKFKTALESKNPDFKMFALKVKFTTDSGAEHIWLGSVELVNGKYFGVVDNVPETIDEIKIGQRLRIDKRRVSDWMYLDQDKLRGGYTIRMLRNRMSAQEKKAFDKANGFTVDQ